MRWQMRDHVRVGPGTQGTTYRDLAPWSDDKFRVADQSGASAEFYGVIFTKRTVPSTN